MGVPRVLLVTPDDVCQHANLDYQCLQDEDGKVLLTFPEPMKGFRDFLYFDEQLQMSIGNRGSLTIIQQKD